MKRINHQAKKGPTPEASLTQPGDIFRGAESLTTFDDGFTKDSTENLPQIFENRISGNVVYGLKYRDQTTGKMTTKEFDSAANRYDWMQANSTAIDWPETYTGPNLDAAVAVLTEALTDDKE